MAIYALWNNKGGVGKSYLTFQIACEYAGSIRTKKSWLSTFAHRQIRPACFLGGRSCPEAWCSWLGFASMLGRAGTHQLAVAGRLKMGSSLIGAMVSSVM